MDILPIAVSVRVDEKILFANRLCVKLAGLDSMEELIGVNASQSIHPDDREYVNQAKKNGHTTPFKYRNVNMKGETVYLETNTFPAAWNGRPAEVYLSRDISKEVESQISLEKVRDQLLALHSHISLLEEAETLSSVVQITFEALSKTLGYEIIDIIKLEDGLLTDAYSTGHGLTVKLDGPGIVTRAARTRETQLIEDTFLDPDYMTGIRESNMRSELAVPVQVERMVVYILNIESPIPGFFTDLDKKMVEAIALHMSHAITRIKEKIRYREYIDRLEALHRYVVEANTLYTVDGIAESIIQTLKQVLQFRACGIGFVEGDTLEFRYGGIPGPIVQHPLKDRGVSIRAIKTSQVQYVPDVSLDPDYIPVFGDNIKSELAIPLIVNGVVVAVINIESSKPDAFTPEIRELLLILSEHAASSLERIRYMESIERIEKERTREIIDGTSRVTNMVAHDVKSPLSVIKNSVYLLKRGTGDTQNSYDHINNSVDRITEIINDLGELTLTGNLVRVLGDAVELVRNSINGIVPPDNIEIELNVHQEVIFCKFDNTKLGRVISNIASNSFQAMPKGGKFTVDVYTKNGSMILTFADTGVGIPPDNLEKVFNPYYTTKKTGMGLGLSICKQIVEAHQGTIEVESTIGVGTTFTVIIPI